MVQLKCMMVDTQDINLAIYEAWSLDISIMTLSWQAGPQPFSPSCTFHDVYLTTTTNKQTKHSLHSSVECAALLILTAGHCNLVQQCRIFATLNGNYG